MRKKDKDNRIKKNYNRDLSKEYGVEELTKCPTEVHLFSSTYKGTNNT